VTPGAVALVCPSCGEDLSGLDTDALFGCEGCAAVYEPSVEGSLAGPYPLLAGPTAQGGAAVALPFFRLRVEAALPAGVPPIGLVYQPAFDMRRRGYFGDPALSWTIDRRGIVASPAHEALVGGTLRRRDAERLAYFSLLRAVDETVDVTDLEVEARFLDPAIVLVGFADEGDALVDPVGGGRYSAVAFCDLPALRAVAPLEPRST